MVTASSRTSPAGGNTTKGKAMTISVEQKSAMAVGRVQGRAVNTYLTMLQENKPKRGRKRTPESIQKRLDAIAEEIETAQPATVVQLVAEQRQLSTDLKKLDTVHNTDEAEEAFVEVAKEYSKRKNIPYPVWRKVGVPADVLKRAGIPR